MKRIVILLLVVGTIIGAHAKPLRVLHLGKEGTDAPEHSHVLMRELGREAIWFEYMSDATQLNREWLGRFDVVLLDAPREDFQALSALASSRIVTIDFPEEQSAWGEPRFIDEVREKLLSAAGAERREEWEAFLAGREPEQREPRSNIANYERRAEPITFQYPFSVKGSKERTQVAPDLRLELFAAEPDILKPIAMAWDERGRCWVAETADYPHYVQPAGQGNDSIRICEDTDGDGKADKFTVFADNLNIPTSLVFANGGVIVSQPPRFLFLKDTDGDDRADVRTEIMTGWGIGDTHAQANSLHWGFDNWLYGCVGYSGFDGVVGGVEKEFRMGTFRFKADGSALEFLHQFSNNSWAHSVNEAGDQFGGTANGAPIFYGGIPATAFPKGMRGMTAKKINIQDKAHTITPNFRQVDVFGGFTAAAGSAFIYSDNLPARLQGKAMVCEPTMKLIALMDVQPDGAGYIAKDAFNLVASSDEWMSPVFAEVGPDGAVWFADWQNFIIQHNPTPSVERGGYEAKTGVGGAHVNPLRDHQRGRIYRVVWEKAKEPAITSLAGAPVADLVEALSSGNQFWRLTAQRLLVEGNQEGASNDLKRLVLANDGSVGAVHALWSLHGLGMLDEATHQAALLATDPALRRNAVRALGNDERSQKLFFGAGVITDPDLVTRLAAFVKLAEFPTAAGIQTVVRSLARNPENRSDEWLAEAVRLLATKHETELYREGPNLLPNGSLEVVGADGLPEGWRRRDYGNRPANLTARWEIIRGADQAHTGQHAVRCSAEGVADTSLYADVVLKPNTLYRLAGWVRGKDLRGRLSFNDHINRHETERVTRDGDWTEVEVVFNSRNSSRGSINILFVARGQGDFDDVRLVELLPSDDGQSEPVLGNVQRGEQIFFKHAAACVLCHSLNGEGSTVGPPLDGIASRKDFEYIRESLVQPNKVLAEGYEGTGLSPMPPMGDIFTAQELADVEAFLKTLTQEGK